MDFTKLNSDELRDFEDALETFKASIEKRCDKMEDGISGCSKYMLDETSVDLLAKATQTINDIRSCLNPTILLLVKVRELIEEMEQGAAL